MEIFGVVAGAAQAFESCVRAYRFLDVANHIGKDASQILSQLEWEYYRLSQWGKRSGIEKSPSDRLNWHLAGELLKEQLELLTSAEKLKEKYHLNIDKMDSKDLEKLQDQRIIPESGFRKYMKRLLPPEPHSYQSQIIQDRNNPIRRLRWASVGKDQADRVVRDIAALNDRLTYLLDSADREWINETSTAVLRDIISRSTNATEVNTVKSLLDTTTADSDKSLAAAASLKEIRFAIAGGKRSDERTQTQSARLALRELLPHRLTAREPSTPLQYTGFEAASYHGEDVIVEWRIVEDPLWTLFEKHIRRLGLLLSKMDDPSFHTLPLRGLLPWRQKERFGFVYTIPIQGLEGGSPRQYGGLHTMLHHVPNAPLQGRIKIAIEMAETVLQLHTAGWLHKGIRSENILFFFAHADASTHGMLEGKAYLVGFEHARPDSKAGEALTQLPSTSLLTDLYRHPDARGIHRKSFLKKFDLYGLGCLLIELALWRPLVNIMSDFHKEGLDNAVAKAEAQGNNLDLPSLLNFTAHKDLKSHITHSAGNSYYDAIKLCLCADDNDDQPSLKTQQAILEKLQSIKV